MLPSILRVVSTWFATPHKTAIVAAASNAGVKDPVDCTRPPVTSGASDPPTEPPMFDMASTVAISAGGASVAASAQPLVVARLALNRAAEMAVSASAALQAR